MTLRSILDALRSIPPLPRFARFRPRVEPLDGRCMPSFSPAVNYAVGDSPQAVVAGLFNNDTILDLAVVNTGSSTVSVLLGNGNGTFQPAVNSATGSSPLSAAVGDFDKDGKMDLATANSGGVSVLLGNGDGTFEPPTSLALSDGSGPRSVAVGDFNDDGKMDLGVTANYYHPGYYYWGYYGYYWYPGYYTGSAHVLIGDGLGGFSEVGSGWLGYGYHTSAAVDDFDGDGDDDFAAANPDYGTIDWLTGDGLGSLGGLVGLYPGGSPQAVAAGDVNGDGEADLVTANGYTNNVGVLLGDGQGGFGAAQAYGTGNYPASLALADFNRDGKPDVATANSGTGDVAVILGKGNGTFTPPISSPFGFYPTGVVAGDFNGDSWPDAASANYSGGSASVLLNDQSWPPANPPSVSINDMSVTEGNTASVDVTFTLTLSAAYSQPVSVYYTLADGSATAGSDYTGGSGDVTIPAGNTTRTFTVTILGDRLPEPSEDFLINLGTPSNAFIADGQGVGTIVDNEPRVTIEDVSKPEGNGSAKSATKFIFTVQLSAAYDQAVTVNFATANGSATVGDKDYTATTGKLTFAPGETTKTITVSVLPDKRKEANEWFAVNLGGASSTALTSDPQGLGWILNDDKR